MSMTDLAPGRLAALTWLSVLSVMSATAAEVTTAGEAVQASIKLIPGDDISNDFRAHDIRMLDMDGDGVEEILFLLTATCHGANFDCPNQLVVLTRLQPGDGRFVPQSPGLSATWDADLAAVRKSGYGSDSSVQIPGPVERIDVSDNRLSVTFSMAEDTPTCLRRYHTADGYKSAAHCPPPGRYTWLYEWQPGAFRAVATPGIDTGQ